MDVDALKARLPASIAGQVQSILVKGSAATVVVDATGMGPDAREEISAAIKEIIGDAEGVEEVRVAMLADKKPIRIIAVGSGKGGVGKSTLTANLAVALAKLGIKVGVVDADIYGPSQPKILANEGERPEARDDKMIPVASKYGVPLLSMGHLVASGQAIAWRGPMAGNALNQLIDAHWADLGIDTLLIDLPPGTGDVQLTMLSKHKPAGAVIVSTPQDLALIDAQRAAQMFDSGKVPLIGLVENMAGYVCPHCNEISNPFGRGGVEAVSSETGIPFLGRIPLAPEIRSASDEGTPPAAGDDIHGQPFHAIAAKLAEWLETGAIAGEEA